MFIYWYAGTTTITRSTLCYQNYHASESWRTFFQFEHTLQGKTAVGVGGDNRNGNGSTGADGYDTGNSSNGNGDSNRGFSNEGDNCNGNGNNGASTYNSGNSGSDCSGNRGDNGTDNGGEGGGPYNACNS
ncbi:hypothetical protein K7432_017149 [Basidiobolus ranarum]|uniref:Uncharacterized protein n=1 Tax=Basidiobolus ranarum TaxID=34480 RepID=A0ABR2WDR5_9FUNG